MIYSTSDPRGLAVHHALSEEICLFVRPSFPEQKLIGGEAVRLHDIASLPLVLPGRGHGLRDLIEDAALSTRATINPVVEIDSYRQIKELVMRGVGFGILPRMAIARKTQAGVFRSWPFEKPALTRKIYLAYSTQRPLLTAPRAIGQLSWEILRQLVKENVWTAELSDESQRPNLHS